MSCHSNLERGWGLGNSWLPYNQNFIFHQDGGLPIVAMECMQVKKDPLKALLNEPTQRVCLTTDTWTSNQRINYMCLTTHFIDKDWKIHKRILNFCPIVSHKSEAIGLAIEKCLRDWEITRVLTVTVDNASSNDIALVTLKSIMSNWDTSILGCEHLYMRCVAHILNLIVQDGLKVYNESISKVRNVVKYVRQSPSRLKRFKECVEFEKIECAKLLCLDVPTRWNSTYKMLEVLEKFERAFDRYDEQDPEYKYDLQVESGGLSVDGRPTFDNWIVGRQFASFLRIFYDLTLKISGSSYVTSNLFLYEIYVVYSILHGWTYGNNVDMYNIGVKMLEKFKKHWADPTKMKNLLFIFVVIDPRHKLQFVVYMLKHMYGEEVGEKMGKCLEETLFRMFNEYKSRIKPNKERDDVREKNFGPVHTSPQLRLQFEKDIGMILYGGSSSDLDEYLSEKPKNFRDSDEFDILGWWRLNSMRFSILSQMARDILALPISTLASKSAFSTGGRVLNDFRSSLTPKMVQALVCAQDWMRETTKAINVEEDIEEMEKLEEALINMDLGSGSTLMSTTAASLVA